MPPEIPLILFEVYVVVRRTVGLPRWRLIEIDPNPLRVGGVNLHRDNPEIPVANKRRRPDRDNRGSIIRMPSNANPAKGAKSAASQGL
jgi:hypothetical protein